MIKRLKYLLIGYCFCLAIPSLAQDSLNLEKYYPKPKNYKIQFFIGPSLNYLKKGNEDGRNNRLNKIGYSLGIGVTRNIGKRFELNARLSWERKGYKQDYFGAVDTVINGVKQPWLSGTITNDITIDYTTFSLSPQFRISKNFTISSGVYISSLQKAVEVYDFFYPTRHLFSFNALGGYEDVDYGITIYLGYSLNIGKNLSITLQLLDNIGLKQIWKFYNMGFPPKYNNSYSMQIGLAYSIKRTCNYIFKPINN